MVGAGFGLELFSVSVFLFSLPVILGNLVPIVVWAPVVFVVPMGFVAEVVGKIEWFCCVIPIRLF